MADQKTMTAAVAIKTFFEMSAKDALVEIKALSAGERRELAELCCKALGVQLVESVSK